MDDATKPTKESENIKEVKDVVALDPLVPNLNRERGLGRFYEPLSLWRVTHKIILPVLRELEFKKRVTLWGLAQHDDDGAWCLDLKVFPKDAKDADEWDQLQVWSEGMLGTCGMHSTRGELGSFAGAAGFRCLLCKAIAAMDEERV